MNDDELYTLLLKGNEETLINIMQRHTRLLWGIAGAILKNVGSSEDVEECVSDVFTELWQKPSGWNPKKGSLQTYLALIIKRRALNVSKRLRRLQTVPIDESASSGDVVLGDVLNIAAGEAAENAVNSLPEPDREIFIRRHVLDQKPDAIARAMGLTARQVTNKLYRGRGKLKAMLKDWEGAI